MPRDRSPYRHSSLLKVLGSHIPRYQRTRLLGGRAGRIILLGDGTEILTSHGDEDDDDDVDMEDRGEAEEVNDDEKSSEDSTRTQREETPAPTSKVEEVKEDGAPEEPKIMAATDSADTKKVLEDAAAK